MRGYRNYTLEQIEQDRIAYRRHPIHAGRTWTDVKAERARRWRHIKQGLMVLSGMALLVAMWVLR